MFSDRSVEHRLGRAVGRWVRLFIASLFFDATRRFFSAWIAQLANYGLITVFDGDGCGAACCTPSSRTRPRRPARRLRDIDGRRN